MRAALGVPGASGMTAPCALSTNTVTKAVVALVTGKRPYATAIWPGLALVLGAAWLGALAGRSL